MMKKSLFITMIVATAVAATWYFVPKNSASDEIVAIETENHEEEGLPKEQRIAEAMQYRFDLLKNEDGVVDPADYYAAIAQADALKQASGKANGVLNLEWDFMGPDNVGGRTRAVLFEKDTPGLMFAGSVGGRLWKSTDDGQNWSIVEGYQGHSAIASMAQAPDGTIYVGTGAGLDQIGSSSFNSGNIGNGIWKSTDKGETWEQLPSTNTFVNDNITGQALWTEVNDLSVDPNNSSNIIAGVNGRIMVSVDAGSTWTQISSIITGQTQAVEIATDGSVAYVAVNGRIYRSESTSSFLTWTQMTAAGSSSRADVAIAPSNPDVVYASHTNTCIAQITRTTDGGATWEQIVDNNGPDPFNQPTADGCEGQGWYDHTIAVNPVDENKLYIGGITLYTWAPGVNGLKRADQIGSEGQGIYDPQYIHADKHEIVFNPHDATGNTMIVGNDGGMALSNNAFTGFPDNMTYKEINKNYGTFQVYGMGAGKYGDVIGGSQDNGSIYVDLKGSSQDAGFEVSGGDGGFGEVSNLAPTVMFSNSYEGILYRSIDGGQGVNAFVDANIGKGCSFILCSNAAAPDCETATGSGSFVNAFHLMETSQRTTPTNDAFLYIERIDTLGANDYNIVLSNGETLSQTNTIVPSGDYLVNSKTIKGFQFEATTTQVLTLGDTLPFADPYNSKYFISSTCGIWMCTNPLSIGEEPVFYNINSTPNARAYAHSTDGDVLFAAAGGLLYRISGLDGATYPEAGCNESTNNSTCFNNTITVDNFSVSGISGNIEGISVDPNDANHVIVTAAGFGGTTKVMKSINALSANPTFTSIQGNLPVFPTYSCVIDASNPNNYIIGGEIGIWTSNDAGISWTEENQGINRLPAYSMRQEWMYEEGCNVIYVGTHGGGMFATTTLTDNGCNKTYGEYPSVGINDVESIVNTISVYPNPATTVAKVKFELERSNTISIKVIDFMGRVVGENNYAGTAGVQEVKVDVTNYATGTYMVVLSVDGKPNASAMMIKK